MRTSTDKKATTLRLTPGTKAQLENVSRALRASESTIAETALVEYFRNHGYYTRYIMKANKSCYALVKQYGDEVSIVDVQVRNGIPLEEIRQTYVARFDSPVDLIVDEGASV